MATLEKLAADYLDNAAALRGARNAGAEREARMLVSSRNAIAAELTRAVLGATGPLAAAVNAVLDALDWLHATPWNGDMTDRVGAAEMLLRAAVHGAPRCTLVVTIVGRGVEVGHATLDRLEGSSAHVRFVNGTAAEVDVDALRACPHAEVAT